ncbi:MAG: hypothetical protein FWH19_01960 [Treponema sp.]|nr:hypothetical protein [Treponema sp.]
MVDRRLIDTFNLQAKEFATKWKNMVRKTPQLKHYHAMSDEAMVDANSGFYPLLSKTLDRGLDRNLLGDFFVKLGKTRMQEGFPLSEVVFAISFSQDVVIEYIMTEFAPESPVRMYQSMEVVSRISEFFLLGCFYLTKGYMEIIYTEMNIQDSVSEELLKKYFKDDFFFK